MALYTTASSLCHQAFWPRDRVAQLEREYPFDLYGVGFWGSVGKLKEALAAFRRAGMAQVLDRKLARMAAPLYTIDGELAGSIGASCIAARRPSLRARQAVARDLLLASRELGERLERMPILLSKTPQPLNV